MRTARWVRGIIVAAAAFAVAAISGCAGFWDPLPNSGGGTNPISGIFYVLNQKTNQLAGFTFAAGASSPTAVTNSPYALSSQPLAMAISPSGSYLYVSTLSGIVYYTINSDGSLTAGNSGQILSSDTAFAMQVDPSGSWLIESVSGSGVLAALPLDSGTGALNGTAQTVNLPATTLKEIAISPSGSGSPYVFVGMGTGGTAVVAFNSGNSNPFGVVSKIGVKNSLGSDNAVAVDPENRLLYIGETVASSGSQSGGLRVFTIGSSSISEISGSPYASGGTGPSAILATQSYVYVANSSVSGSSTGNISGFSVVTSTSGTSYSLTAINTVSAGSLTSSLAEDSTGAYILAVNFSGSPDLSTFTFDSTTAGQLDAGPTAATGTDPTGAGVIVAAP
jgi:6-phosphogluconolactonase